MENLVFRRFSIKVIKNLKGKILLEKITAMFDMQIELNNATIKTHNWYKGYSPDGMPISWIRYIKLETAELAESFPIKHWKDINKEIDVLNVKIELVDIWHFLLSEIICLSKLNPNIERDYFISQSKDVFEEILSNNSSLLIKDKIIATKIFIKALSRFEFIVSEYDLFYEDCPFAEKMFMLKKILHHLALLCNLVGLNFEELYKLYIGKNCLNNFRQENGYKDGTYKKIWFNTEDNVVMYTFLQKIPIQEFNITLLKSCLEDEYKKVFND